MMDLPAHGFPAVVFGFLPLSAWPLFGKYKQLFRGFGTLIPHSAD